MRMGVIQRLIAIMVVVCIVGSGTIALASAAAQEETPTPAPLPQGPLGAQIQWLVDYINLPEDAAAAVDLGTVFAPGVLADVPADQLQQILSNIRVQLSPVTVDNETIVTTRDSPPTGANFTLVGRDGTQLPTSMTVDPVSGLISSIWFAAPVAPVATFTPTVMATATEMPTTPPTETPTLVPTDTPTIAPSNTPTPFPTDTPTPEPTETPTMAPTETPTLAPTDTPTPVPTETPTLAPTETPTPAPTETPTLAPTQTSAPTDTPTPEPTETATLEPTETPTSTPTETATLEPTETPTPEPTDTSTPTDTPTLTPTETPTLAPTETATLEPTETPTVAPTKTATLEPTRTPTRVPTETPTPAPTETATSIPTDTATLAPTHTATLQPTRTATEAPTDTATDTPVSTMAASPGSVATGMASPEGSPSASPVALVFPEGPLGDQAAWTWEVLNNGGEPISESEVEAHVAPELLAQVPAAQIVAGIAQVQQQFGPFTLDPTTIVVSANEPPTNLSYIVTGNDGTLLQVSVSIDPASGLLTGFLISPASQGTPVVASLPAGMTDTEVSFTSGGDTIYGSFLASNGLDASVPGPAALIISGSGPTDRNGNSGNLSMNTNLNLATTLAQQGIPSLRYDKLGSGQTGLGSHTDVSDIDYELYLQEAKDAAAFLAEQPGVDPSRLILVGHSEGALFALVLAQAMTEAGTPPAGLILAAPLSVRYLDILQTQLEAQGNADVASGQMTDERMAELSTELQGIIDSLRKTGALPDTAISPELSGLFTAANATFLAQIDQIDPGDVAASLPADLPVLVLLGYKDAQVTGDEVRHLLDGFSTAGNDNVRFAALPKADHTLRIVEGDADPSVDYANPDLEFSPQAVSEIDAFLQENGLAPTA